MKELTINKPKVDNDSWETPQELFNELDKKYGPFKVDLCATAHNTKCDYYFKDFLNDDFAVHKRHLLVKPFWEDLRCFMNPPYSNPKPFIQRAWQISRHWPVVCLIKCDPSTSMWQIFYDFEKHQELPGCKVILLNKRVKFNPPKGWTGKTSGPSFPSAVLIFDRRGL